MQAQVVLLAEEQQQEQKVERAERVGQPEDEDEDDVHAMHDEPHDTQSYYVESLEIG
jgi:hypothetical protein